LVRVIGRTIPITKELTKSCEIENTKFMSVGPKIERAMYLLSELLKTECSTATFTSTPRFLLSHEVLIEWLYVTYSTHASTAVLDIATIFQNKNIAATKIISNAQACASHMSKLRDKYHFGSVRAERYLTDILPREWTDCALELMIDLDVSECKLLLQIVTSKRYMDSVVGGVVADLKKDWIDNVTHPMPKYYSYSRLERPHVLQKFDDSKQRVLAQFVRQHSTGYCCCC
jgi:hypothetical protein